MTYYVISRGDDGKFYIHPVRLSYAGGVGDFYALERYGIIGEFASRKEAEEYLDNTPVKGNNHKSLNFKFNKD